MLLDRGESGRYAPYVRLPYFRESVGALVLYFGAPIRDGRFLMPQKSLLDLQICLHAHFDA